MTHAEILEQIKKLPLKERLEIVDGAIHLIRDELTRRTRTSTQEDRKKLLSKAAIDLLQDYQTNSDLTSFTALDGEDFQAQG